MCVFFFVSRCATKLTFCINFRNKELCPLDRTSLDPRSRTDIYLDLAIERTILDFHVKCPHDKNGCKWTGEVRSAEKHEAHCSFIGVKCTNKGCKETPLQNHLQEHLTKECLMREELCQYCKTSFIFCKGKEHVDKCTKYPLPCTQRCGQPIPRDQMSNHLKETCSRTLVKCKYTHVGCMEEVPRGALDQHLKENTELHLKMACEKLREFQDLLVGNVGNVKQIQARVVKADKRIGDINDKQETFQSEFDSLNNEVKGLEERVSDLEKLQQEVASIKSRQNNLSRKLGQLTKRVSNDQARLEDSMNSRLHDLQDSVRRNFDKQQYDCNLIIGAVTVAIIFLIILVIAYSYLT